MQYDIKNMWFDSVRLDRTAEEIEGDSQYELTVTCAMDYNATDKQSVRFVMEFSLHSSSKFRLSGVHYTIIEFKEQLTEDEAEEEMVKINAPSLLYPYIRAFSSNILSSSGFACEHLPLVFFEKE
ncbi:TPA: protein-export chaperone SecB [Citrobacter braakii]|nr:protein-export chaperone SecB [Citrobacter braakii]